MIIGILLNSLIKNRKYGRYIKIINIILFVITNFDEFESVNNYYWGLKYGKQ